MAGATIRGSLVGEFRVLGFCGLEFTVQGFWGLGPGFIYIYIHMYLLIYLCRGRVVVFGAYGLG